MNCLLQAHKAEHEYEKKKDALQVGMLTEELYHTLLERNNRDDEITAASLKVWIKEGTTSSDILRRMHWSAHFIRATHTCCIKDHNRKASLKDMRRFWKHAHDKLTVSHSVEYLQPCFRHMENMEGVAKAFTEATIAWTAKGVKA